MKSDRNARIAQARVDDRHRRDLISTARRAIYEQNFDIDSAAVERIMKPESLVPTSVSEFATQHLSLILCIEPRTPSLIDYLHAASTFTRYFLLI
jgi:hypothetical protein